MTTTTQTDTLTAKTETLTSSYHWAMSDSSRLLHPSTRYTMFADIRMAIKCEQADSPDLANSLQPMVLQLETAMDALR